MTTPFLPVALEHASRLLNHGPTVLVTSAHDGRRNIMAAAWSMPVEFTPPRIAIVIDKRTFTRELVAASGAFGVCIPGAALADLTFAVGSCSVSKNRGRTRTMPPNYAPYSGVIVALDQDHDSWAVERLKDGEAEPTLVKPWTMGSDKKNPTGFVNDGGDVNIFRTVNQLYGNQPPGFTFAQANTVETLYINGTAAFGTGYSDPSGKGGNYALGMLSSRQNDLLGLAFDVGTFDYLNVRLAISSIDLSVFGGPFVASGAVPVFSFTLKAVMPLWITFASWRPTPPATLAIRTAAGLCPSPAHCHCLGSGFSGWAR